MLPGINRKFDLFPQKCVLRQVFTPIWGTIGKISPISTKFTYFYNHLHTNFSGCMQYSWFKIHIIKKLTLNHFNVKLYYFGILPKY